MVQRDVGGDDCAAGATPLLTSTACWLVTNVLAGSVGGTILESLIAAASLSTIVRMALEARAERPAASGVDVEGAAS